MSVMNAPSGSEHKAMPRIEELITQAPYKPPLILNCLRALCSCFRATNILPFYDEESALLLPEKLPSLEHKKTIVIDLDETLVHSAFSEKKRPDFVLDITYNSRTLPVYVKKRPGVDRFLEKCGELFEVVIFTASVQEYADPLIDILDVSKSVKHRLYRQDCSLTPEGFVKDLSRLNRPLKDIFIVDPENALPVASWFKDRNDKELIELFPTLELLSKSTDVRDILAQADSKSILILDNESEDNREEQNSPLSNKTITVESLDHFKCVKANNSFH